MIKRAVTILGLLVLLTANVSALTLYFWDTNGETPGSGGPAPTGTWGVDAYWSPDDGAGNAGTRPTEPWNPGNIAVFAADDDATGAYTVYVSGLIKVADIHVDLGQVTFSPAASIGGSIDLRDSSDNGSDRLLSVGHKDPNAVARFDVPITGATNIIRYKRGTLIFGVTNNYAGSTTIEGGVLQLGASYLMPTSSSLILSNDNGRGDVASMGLTGNTPATYATAGFSQKLGP